MFELVVGVVLAVVGLAVLWPASLRTIVDGVRDLHLSATVYRRPVETVADAEAVAADAETRRAVQLEGTARVHDSTLTTAFAGHPSLSAAYEVEERSGGQYGNSWVRILERTEHVPFLLEDETGRILVDPDGADFEFATDDSFEIERGNRPYASIRTFLEDTRLEPDEDEGRRYSEGSVDPERTAHVVGPVELLPEATDGDDVVAVLGAEAGHEDAIVSNTTATSTTTRLLWSGATSLAYGLFLVALVGFGLVVVVWNLA